MFNHDEVSPLYKYCIFFAIVTRDCSDCRTVAQLQLSHDARAAICEHKLLIKTKVGQIGQSESRVGQKVEQSNGRKWGEKRGE